MYKSAFRLAAATLTIVAFAAPATPVSATTPTTDPPIGECYALDDKQMEATFWSADHSDSMIACDSIHNIQILGVTTLPGTSTGQSISRANVRQAEWKCRQMQMKSGPLTRLNGPNVFHWFSSDTTTGERKAICGVAMTAPTTWDWIDTTKSLHDTVPPFCVRWQGRGTPSSRVIPRPCKPGAYKLFRIVSLDNPTFTATYPGRDAVRKKMHNACGKRYDLYLSPSRKAYRADDHGPIGSCYRKV